MALSEQEELELLTLERERAFRGSRASASQADVRKAEPVAPPEPSGWDKAKDLGAFGLRKAWDVTPMGVLSNAGALLDSTAYKAGGAVTDFAAESGASPDVAAGAGTAVNVGIQSVPAFLGRYASGPIESAMKQGARNVMLKTLKPDKEHLLTGKAAKAVETMLEQRIWATPGGLQQLKDKIGALNDEIADMISNSTQTIDIKNKARAYVQMELNKLYKQSAYKNDVKAAKEVLDQLNKNPLIRDLTQVPVQLAQEIKQGTHKSVGPKSYGPAFLGQPGQKGEVAAEKAIARVLKEGIAAKHPEVASLNAQESALLNAQLISEAKILMNATREPAGWAWWINHPAIAISYLTQRSPTFRSILAQGLYRGGKPLSTAAGTAYGAGVLGASE